MDVIWEVAIEDLVVGSVEVVAFENVNYFKDENTGCFNVNALLLDLVA